MSGLFFSRDMGFIGRTKTRSYTHMLLRKRSTHGECSFSGLFFASIDCTNKESTRFCTHMLRAQAVCVFFVARARKPWRVCAAAAVWRCMRSRHQRCFAYNAAVAVTLRLCLDKAEASVHMHHCLVSAYYAALLPRQRLRRRLMTHPRWAMCTCR